ncbi:MAG: DUF4013 domain-containing protein [Haloferacaceae archaeon]
MLREALAFPFAGERRGRRILGTLVMVASIPLLVTAPIYVGYLVRLLRDVAYGDAAPPRNADIGGLFVEGLTALSLVTAYAAVPLAPFVVASLPFVDVALGTPGRVALAAVSLLLAYVLPAVLASYAVDASVVGGLAGRRIWRALTSRDYLVAWIPAAVVGAAVVASVWVLGLFGIAPSLVVGPPVVLYGTLVAGHLLARGFAASVELARRPVVRDTGPAG